MVSAVRNNPARSRYELDVDGDIAYANYRMRNGVVEITHTETPAALRGRGIGEKVMLGALEQIRTEGLKVKPLCSFARHVIAQHPEAQDLLAR